MNKIMNIIDTILWVFLMVAVVGFFGAMEYHQYKIKIFKQVNEQYFNDKIEINVDAFNKPITTKV